MSDGTKTIRGVSRAVLRAWCDGLLDGGGLMVACRDIEIARLRRRVAQLERRLARVLVSASTTVRLPPPRRGRVWSGRR